MVRILSDTEQILAQHSGPVPVLPWTFHLHGTGFMFYGCALHHRDLGVDRYVRAHWLTIAFMPIFPLGVYLVSDEVDETGRPTKRKSLFGDRKTMLVHRRVYARGVVKIWGAGGVVWLLGSAYVVVLIIFLAMLLVVMLGNFAGWWNASG